MSLSSAPSSPGDGYAGRSRPLPDTRSFRTLWGETAGNGTRRGGLIGPAKSNGGVALPGGSPKDAATLHDTVRELQEESKNPRQELLVALENYKAVELPKVGGVKARVAPHVLTRLYRAGKTAKREV